MKLILISIVLSFHLKAVDNLIIPPHVKTQKQLSKYQVKRYLKSFPKIALDCTKFYLRGSSYHRLLRNQGPAAFQNSFKLNYHKRFPKTENHFPFDNGDVGDVCERDFGYCHGFSVALTNWNRLSHFDPENINKANYPKDVGSDRWFEYYRKIIDRLMNDKDPVIIPGYHHLYEFAGSHPRITNYLKEHIALEWAERNINLSSYFKVLRQVYHTFTIKEAKALYKKLDFKINELNHNPVLWIASGTSEQKQINPLEIPGSIHNMQAYRLDPIDKNGDFKVYFWDIYSPNDAENATSIYTISTVKKNPNKKNKPLIIKEVIDSKGKALKRKETFDGVFDFADMDTVPFDEINLGKEVVKLTKFYQDHPEFTKYLEKRFEDYIKNPPPKFRVPYKGEEPAPEIKLADGSIWKFPKEMLYFDGDIWIEKQQISSLPDKVIKALDKLTKVKWREGEKINRYDLQLPRPYEYHTGDMDHQEFKFDLSWFDYDGKFIPNQQFFDTAPKELIDDLKKYTLNWPPTKPLNLKYFQNHSHLRMFPEVGDDFDSTLWDIPIEFITENGQFHIPTKYISEVPEKVIDILKKQNLWPLEHPINLSYMTKKSRTIKMANSEIVLPIKWYLNSDEDIIKVPAKELKNYPKELSEFIYGFGPRAHSDFFEISPSAIDHAKIRYNDETYIFPQNWFPKSDDFNFSIDEITIPQKQIEFVPAIYRDIIVGKGGQWPPVRNKFSRYTKKFYLKDGSHFQFPLSWIVSGELTIPKSQRYVLPQKIIDEIFSKGPFKWPLKEPIPLYDIQLSRMKLEDGTYFLWPREWMKYHEDGIKLKLPKSVKKIESMIPKEIQDKIKQSYNGNYPQDRIIEAWRMNFEDFEDLEGLPVVEEDYGFFD